MEVEADFTGDLKCDKCKKKDSEDCNMLKDRFIAEDNKVFRELWDNLKLVEKDGQMKVEVKYLYRHDPHSSPRTQTLRKQKEEQTL